MLHLERHNYYKNNAFSELIKVETTYSSISQTPGQEQLTVLFHFGFFVDFIVPNIVPTIVRFLLIWSWRLLLMSFIFWFLFPPTSFPGLGAQHVFYKVPKRQKQSIINAAANIYSSSIWLIPTRLEFKLYKIYKDGFLSLPMVVLG